jgi:phosphate transport system substrate-binding protein
VKNILILTISIFLILVLCVSAYFLFTKTLFVSSGLLNNANYIPEFSIENYPKIDGSTVVASLNNAFMSKFTGSKIEELKNKYSDTHQAYVNLINKDVDLIIVTQPLEEELSIAKEKGIELEIITLANESFVFIVSKDNPVDNITSEQIRGIYSGKITNWKELGGNDAKIIPYQRLANSVNQTGMLNIVMNEAEMIKPIISSFASGIEEFINITSEYDNTINSIGYCYYNYATKMYTSDKVKFLSIDGIKPDYMNTQNNTYPYVTSYYIVIDRLTAEDSIVRKLIKAMLSEVGQDVMREAGYVPAK